MVISRARETRETRVMLVRLPAPNIMVISRERAEETSKLVILCWLDFQSPNIMAISREREKRRVTSRRDKQAGDIMLVRLPAPNIMVISRERENRRVSSRRDKLVSWLDYQHQT